MTLVGVAVGLCLGWLAAGGTGSSEPAVAGLGADAAVPARRATAGGLPGLSVCGSIRATASLSAVALPEQAPAPKQSLSELIAQLKTAGPDDGGRSAAMLDRLMRDAQSNPGLRHELIGRFKGERDGAALQALATVISSFPADEVGRVVGQLSQGDAAQRAAAFSLLAMSSQASAASHGLIQKALITEQDVHVLSQAVAALGPRPFIDPQQAQATVARLGALAEHADPGVRSESLRMLAQWDKTGNVAEPLLYRALTADNPEGRTEAVYALAGSDLKTDRVKTALLKFVGNNAESTDSRAAALQALERFPLSSDEYALHSRISAALNGSIGAAVSTQSSAQAEPSEGSAMFSPFQR
jgi:hypothetical protein